MKPYIHIQSSDYVAVALANLSKGTFLHDINVTLAEDISLGHKFAVKDISKGDAIIKYGAPIGTATEDILRGHHVHTHNTKTTLNDNLEYTYTPMLTPINKTKTKTFMGYRRKNSAVGVRNEVWIIPTVGCVNNIATAIAKQCEHELPKNIDAVVAFPHPYGCSQMGDDQDNTLKILADLINHPNAGAVLVLGLGCENCNIDVLKPYLGEIDGDRVKFIVAQEHDDEIADGVDTVKKLIDYASKFKREAIDCSELIIGMKCGGSDGLSGITANPTVGVFSDILISHGGSTILTEVPEMFGAETLLMNRCANAEVFDKTVSLINDFKDYFKNHNQTIYENPSPGNKAGGITTLEDKSLGCTQKSGTAVVVDVLSYGERLHKKGLNLLNSPGNDLVASTALAASGAHIVLFTTGRGTPFASPVPTMKISSNSHLANKKSNWIDFDCGTMVSDKSLTELGEELFEEVIRIASGKKIKAELAGFHDLAIFKQGVTL